MEVQKWREILIPYQQVVRELEVKFNSIINENHKLGKHSPIEFVSGRVKKISSILDKAKRKNIPFDQIEETMEDIAGIRIICQFVDDIESVVTIIKNRYDMEVISEKNYIDNVKDSGYRSYHMIIRYLVHTSLGPKFVQAEIQIRTLSMNFWATIEHSLNYKYKRNIPNEIKQRLIRAADAAHKLDEEMTQIRSEILEAQDDFQYRSSIISDILNNIQNIDKRSPDPNEAKIIQEEFNSLWEQGKLSSLIQFSRRLDMISERYKAQSLDNM